MRLLILLALAACQSSKTDGPCQCTPANVSRTQHEDLLALLRRHQALAAQDANHRDIKLVDDEIRLIEASLCQPCGDWVGDRATVDEMFPLARLPDATRAVCLGLELRDGTFGYGTARPAACR